MANGAALHHDEGMLPVLAVNGRRKAQHILGRCRIDRRLKCLGGDRMTLVNDDLTVFLHTRIDNTLARQRLDDGNVNLPRPPRRSTTNPSNLLLGNPKEL